MIAMNRFRFTLLAICLVLIYLGWSDVSLFLRNPEPLPIAIEELELSGAPREWLRVTGGYQDLTQAISTSGSVELDALLVPLKSAPDERGFRVLVETRDPHLLNLFKTYHFLLDSVLEKEKYLTEHQDEFVGRIDVTGTLVGGLIASGNRDKLLTLARDIGMDVSDEVIFISEGKEPATFRGFFFLGIALLGLIKVVLMFRKKTVSREQ